MTILDTERVIIIILSLAIVFCTYLHFKNPQCVMIPANVEQMENIHFDFENKRYKFYKNIIN